MEEEQGWTDKGKEKFKQLLNWLKQQNRHSQFQKIEAESARKRQQQGQGQ